MTQPEPPNQATISADCAEVILACARLLELLEPVPVPVHVQVVAQQLSAALAALTADLEAAQPARRPPCDTGPFF